MAHLSPTSSTSSAPDAQSVLGSTLPRIFTPPLITGPPGPCGCGCALTPDTSYGFDVDDFAREILHHPLDPWQRWLAIHAGELLPDGSPRFSTILVLVARQNGKTELLVVLTLYWLYIERITMVLGTSTKLDYAKESWLKAVQLARAIPDLAAEIPKRGGVRKANGEQELVVVPSDAQDPNDADDPDACRYKIAASNDEGGRSLTIGRLILDELRQHQTYEAWDASEPTTSAVPGSQIWALSNAGSTRSIVLNDLRTAAIAFIDNGEGDDDLMIAEWSAPDGANPTDIHALAQANPNLNRRKPGKKLLANARRALTRGGEVLTGFKTEHMCMQVKVMDPAIDPAAWINCHDPGSLHQVRTRTAVLVDVAPDQLHATLYAAAVLDDGRVRIDFVKAWDGAGCTDKVRKDLPGLLAQVRPQVFGWLPNGPAAALAADLADRKSRAGWPPAGISIVEIKTELAAVCMGFAEQVIALQLAHNDDPLLNAQVAAAEPLNRGDVWVFSRKGDGHVDAVYAAAGAAWLARTLPPPAPRPLVLVGRPRGSVT